MQLEAVQQLTQVDLTRALQTLVVRIQELRMQDARIQELPMQDARIQELPMQDARIQELPMQDARIQECQMRAVSIRERLMPVDLIPVLMRARAFLTLASTTESISQPFKTEACLPFRFSA